MRALLCICLVLFLAGCNTLGGLTPIRTKVRFEGDAAALRYAMTGQEPNPYAAAAGPVEFEYETSADKSLLLRMDEKGDAKVVEFESTSDSQYAASSRSIDNARLQAQTESITTMVTAVAAAIAAARTPIPSSLPPESLDKLQELLDDLKGTTQPAPTVDPSPPDTPADPAPPADAPKDMPTTDPPTKSAAKGSRR